MEIASTQKCLPFGIFLCLLRIEAVTVPSQYDNRFFYATRNNLHRPQTSQQMGRFERQAAEVLAQAQAPTVIVQENKALRDALARSNERLNEPFITVNTVTGGEQR